MKQLP